MTVCLWVCVTGKHSHSTTLLSWSCIEAFGFLSFWQIDSQSCTWCCRVRLVVRGPQCSDSLRSSSLLAPPSVLSEFIFSCLLTARIPTNLCYCIFTSFSVKVCRKYLQFQIGIWILNILLSLLRSSRQQLISIQLCWMIIKKVYIWTSQFHNSNFCAVNWY